MKDLKIKIEKRREIDKSKSMTKIDYPVLLVGTALATLSLACAGLGYYIYQKWHKPSTTQFYAICDTLLKYESEIWITTISKNSLSAPHWGLISETKIDIYSPYRSIQEKSIAEYKSQLVSLSDTEAWSFLAEFCAFGGSLFWGALSCLPIYAGLFPCNKERYEKLCLIQEKIDQTLETL